MKRKNTTRNALFTSIISLLLCVSMLVGTTFAWFTDEVVTGMNTIAAGNLDVELYANGEQVKADTSLFELPAPNLWEPGVVAYETLKVANVGTLALEYQMTLNFGSENDLNGHKLSEVLKVGIIDASKVDMTDRAAVLAAAKAATVTEVGEGMLSNFCITGKLEPKTESTEQTVVIFWAPNDNAVDNLYNANNGQKTSDGEPLHIEFGINLQATQMMHENDSFGTDYDMGIDNTPFASIVPLGAKTVPATEGIGGNESEIALDAAFQYEPTLTEEEGLASAYKYYKADFYVYADKDVPAGTVALAGYYSAWCDTLNDGKWVSLTSPVDVEAGAENGVRLIKGMGGGIAVHYKDICQYGNDGIGFLCGLTNLNDVNAGTTITVELRLYETDADPAGSSASNNETGKYITVATAKYTFPSAKVETADELASLLTSNDDSIQVALMNDIDLPITSLGQQTGGSGEYKLGGADTEEIIIELNGHKLNITTGYWSAIGAVNPDATITVRNGSMNSTGNSAGTWNAWDLRFSNCDWNFENVDFLKAVALDNAGKVTNMKNVTITDSHDTDTYALWITTEGQTVNIDGLTIDMLAASDGRGIKIDNQYVDASSKVNLNIANAIFKTEEKAAIIVKSPAGAEIHLSNVDISNVAEDSANEVWVDEDSAAYASKVKVVGGSKFVEGTMVFEADTAQELKDLLTSNTASGSGDNVINLTADLNMTGIDWTPIEVQGYTGAGVITLNGNGKTITGLNAPLFAGGFAGNSGIVIKNLTIADSNIVSTSTTGSGAFIESVDSMQSITLDNCHLKNSTVSGSRTGGLIGWTSGYSNPSDGPVKTYVTITNCSVVGCTITGSSVGAINGHAGASDWTYTTIENCTVTGCTLNSTDDGDWRVGVVVGTANIGEVTINNITESGNTLTQTGKTAPAGQSNLYGRFVPGSTGKLVIDGVAIQ